MRTDSPSVIDDLHPGVYELLVQFYCHDDDGES